MEGGHKKECKRLKAEKEAEHAAKDAAATTALRAQDVARARGLMCAFPSCDKGNAEGAKLRRCSGCRVVMYCSPVRTDFLVR